MDNSKHCIQCGEKMVGRLDKKFCDAQCRNNYNNKIKRKSEKMIIDINRLLRRNRKILKQFNPEGKTTIRKEYLEKLNFEFNFHTHTFTTKNNNTYIFCYEYGYLEIENGEKVLIINQQPYMNKAKTNPEQ
jgi:predicted nucleic acid-binding Zn ribbon protein